MRELAVLSGKGGTGKTSVMASFAVLAGEAVLADADVDASNLSLLLAPSVRARGLFHAGSLAVIDPDRCDGCAACREACRFGAITRGSGDAGAAFSVDPLSCEGCEVCVGRCPRGAISVQRRLAGEWFESETRAGLMVHARLEPPGENSGKLASFVKARARRLAKERGSAWVLVDGPPGVGCPAIAALSGATETLLVAEPTVSGLHDFERVAQLAAHFRVSAALCVNKWDINPDAALRLEENARRMRVRPIGRVRMDPAVTAAQRRGRAVVEEDSPAAREIRRLWSALRGAPDEGPALHSQHPERKINHENRHSCH